MADQWTPSPSQLWAIFRLCAYAAETSSGNFDNPWYIWSISLQVKFSFCFFLRKMRTQTMLTINLTWIKGACYNMTQKRRIDASTRLPMKNFIPFNIWTHPQCCHFSKIMSHFFLIIQGQIYVFNAEGKKGKEISHLYVLLIKLDECAVLWRNGYFEFNSNRLIRLILCFFHV